MDERYSMGFGSNSQGEWANVDFFVGHHWEDGYMCIPLFRFWQRDHHPDQPFEVSQHHMLKICLSHLVGCELEEIPDERVDWILEHQHYAEFYRIRKEELRTYWEKSGQLKLFPQS